MRRSAGSLILYLAFLAIFTLSPFAFSCAHFRQFLDMDPGARLHHVFVAKFYDIAANLLLFVPFGYWLRIRCQRDKPDRFGPFRIPLFAGFVVSLMIELAQLFLPRSTSVVDLACNTCGTLLGFTLAGVLSRLIWRLRYGTPRFFRIAGTAAFALFVLVVFLLPVRSSNFSNWNPEYPVAFYNEPSGDRPWEGEIRSCLIFDRALTPARMDSVFRSRSPDLEKASGATFGVSLSAPETADSAPAISQSLGPVVARPLMRTSEMTLLLRLRSRSIGQTGPARIATQSLDPDRRNWTLGQSGHSLVFRVRTPLSGRNGSRFQLFAPGCLTDTLWHDVAVAYDRGLFRLYVDGKETIHTLNLSRDYLPAMFGVGRSGAAWLVFCFTAFMPFFLLLYAQGRRFRISIAWAGVVLLAFGIELVLHVCTGQPVTGTVPLAAFWIGLAGAGFVKGFGFPK